MMVLKRLQASNLQQTNAGQSRMRMHVPLAICGSSFTTRLPCHAKDLSSLDLVLVNDEVSMVA